MANNPNVNKVELADGSTLIDLTSDTATAGDVVRGETFHLASGAQATGTMDVAGAITDAQVDSVLADSAPTGTDSLRLSQLTRFWNGLKTKFAALVHYHTSLGNASTSVISVNTTLTSVAEGSSTTASDQSAHAEGYNTTASAPRAHAEGYSNTASGTDSHAEGSNNVASGIEAHVEGSHNIASSQAQHVGGRYNVEDDQGTYAEIIGNGTMTAGGTANRSNARTLDWDGNAWHAGEVTATEHVSGGSDVTHNLTDKADQADVDTALAGKAATVHNHSGQAITPASVTATGAIQGSSISDGTGTLAQLRESVSRKGTHQLAVMFSPAAVNSNYHAVWALPPDTTYSSVQLVSVDAMPGVAASSIPPLSDFSVRILGTAVNVYTANSFVAGKCVIFKVTLS